MKKQWVCLILAIVLLAGVCPAARSAYTEMHFSDGVVEYVKLGEDKMSKKIQAGFKEACASLTEKYLTELEKDVTHYCNMYDYRNNGSDADWGNSKDSIERAIKFLTTR